MRKMIAAFKTSLDMKIEGPDGFADWVDGWSDDYGLMGQIDTCLQGGDMYRGYEQYWTAIQDHRPGEPLPMTGKEPTPAEVDWARFAAVTPHYVLSHSQDTAQWPSTQFLRSRDEVAELKRQAVKDIYLMGGAKITSALFDAGLVDEIRLLIYPLLAGEGKALFSGNTLRQDMRLVEACAVKDGLVRLIYVKRP